MGCHQRSIDGLRTRIVVRVVERWNGTHSDDDGASLTCNGRARMDLEGEIKAKVRMHPEKPAPEDVIRFRKLKEALEKDDGTLVHLELEGLVQRIDELGGWREDHVHIVLDTWKKWNACASHAATLLGDWTQTSTAHASTEANTQLTGRTIDQCTSAICNPSAMDAKVVVKLLLRVTVLPACQRDRVVKAIGCLGLYFDRCFVFPKPWDKSEDWRIISELVSRVLLTRADFQHLCATMLANFCRFLALPSEDHQVARRWHLHDCILRRCMALGDAVEKETTAQFAYWTDTKWREFAVFLSCQEVQPSGFPALVQSLCGLLRTVENGKLMQMQEGKTDFQDINFVLWTRVGSIARSCPRQVAERNLALEALSLGLTQIGRSAFDVEVFTRVLLETLFNSAFSLSEVVCSPIEEVQQFLSLMQDGIVFQSATAILRTLLRFLVQTHESVHVAFLEEIVGMSKKFHFDYKELLWRSCPKDMKLLEGVGLGSILGRAYMSYAYLFHHIFGLPSRNPALKVAPILTSLAFLDFCRVQSDILLSLISDCVLLASKNDMASQRVASSIAIPDPLLDEQEWAVFSTQIMEDKLMQSVFLFQMRLLPLLAGVLPGSMIEAKIFPLAMSFLTHSNPLLCRNASLLFLNFLHASKKREFSFTEQYVPSYTRLVLEAFPTVLGVDAMGEALAGLILVYSGNDLSIRLFLQDMLVLAEKMCKGGKDREPLEDLLLLLFQATSVVGLSHLEWYLGSLERLLLECMRDRVDRKLLSRLRVSIARSYDYDRKPVCVAWYQQVLSKI